MSKVIRRTIRQTKINFSTIKENEITEMEVELPCAIKTAAEARRILEKHFEQGVIIKALSTTEGLYELDVETFLEWAKKIETGDSSQEQEL